MASSCFLLLWNAHRSKGRAANDDVSTRTSRRRRSCLPSLLPMVTLSGCMFRRQQASALLFEESRAKARAYRRGLQAWSGTRSRGQGAAGFNFQLVYRIMLVTYFGKAACSMFGICCMVPYGSCTLPKAAVAARRQQRRGAAAAEQQQHCVTCDRTQGFFAVRCPCCCFFYLR